MNFLAQMEAAAKDRVARARAREPFAALLRRARAAPAPRGFANALRARPARQRVIAEAKRVSPSAGAIAEELRAVDIAQAYSRAGAPAVSILTEPSRFGGALADLEAARAALPQQVLLMKDFVIDPYQIAQARAAGADAVLLIVAMLAEPRLRELLNCARELGLDALVEVHDERELEIAARLDGAALIGVNNRDLKTLKVDFGASRRLAARKPAGPLFVAESGLRTRADVADLAARGFDAFLIGASLTKDRRPEESFMKLSSPQPFVKICGLTRAEDAAAAAACGADAVGFVFAASDRAVTVETAATIAGSLPGHVERVGVFVDAPAEEIAKTADAAGLGAAQIHARRADPIFLARSLRALRPELRLWLAIEAAEVEATLELARAAGHVYDLLIVDSPRETGRARVPLSPAMLRSLRSLNKPYLVAGGLRPADVRAALEESAAFGADVASGVESAPGVKDARLMNEFIAACAGGAR